MFIMCSPNCYIMKQNWNYYLGIIIVWNKKKDFLVLVFSCVHHHSVNRRVCKHCSENVVILLGIIQLMRDYVSLLIINTTSTITYNIRFVGPFSLVVLFSQTGQRIT